MRTRSRCPSGNCSSPPPSRWRRWVACSCPIGAVDALVVQAPATGPPASSSCGTNFDVLLTPALSSTAIAAEGALG